MKNHCRIKERFLSVDGKSRKEKDQYDVLSLIFIIFFSLQPQAVSPVMHFHINVVLEGNLSQIQLSQVESFSHFGKIIGRFLKKFHQTCVHSPELYTLSSQCLPPPSYFSFSIANIHVMTFDDLTFGLPRFKQTIFAPRCFL